MALERREVLRINCPGFGVQSHLSIGNADSLDNYRVIIVNPVSVLHLFDKDPELLSQIAVAQSEGTTSYVAKSDKLLESVLPDLETRTVELAQFLKKGGLLVYFLCPPFLIQAPSLTLDNYIWLDILAPDNSEDKNRRNMSSASRGKNVEMTPEGQSSAFAAYMKQPGLEWTTLVRSEKLSEGYTMLATAGPNKCIAAQLEAGEMGGRVIFLPAPFSSEFDDRLVECLNLWNSQSSSPRPAVSASAPPRAESVAPPMSGSAAPTADPPAPPKAESVGPKSESSASPGPEPAAQKKEPAPAAPQSDSSPTKPTAPTSSPPPKSEAAPAPAKASGVPPSGPDAAAKPAETPASKGPAPAAAAKNGGAKPASEPPPASDRPPAAKPEQTAPKPKELMEKMEEISKPATPEWCLKYSFGDLNNLRDELIGLNDQVRLTQTKITEVERRISDMEWLKNALLSADGEDLRKACTKVFELLGWKVKGADDSDDEVWLKEGDATHAIAKIVRTTSQVKRPELAQLAESVITFWGEHETEPKGVMVASTWANRPPSERRDSDYSAALSEFAEKKNLCLMTTWQLLCIYRDVESGQVTPKELREHILSTSGRLPGFILDSDLAKV